MTIGFLRLHVFIPGSNSLKAKRMVLHSLKARLRKGFNVAVAQIGDQDKWQSSVLAVATVEQDVKDVNSMLSCVVNFIEGFHGVQLVDYKLEML